MKRKPAPPVPISSCMRTTWPMKSTLRGSAGDSFCMRLASVRIPRTPTMGTGATDSKYLRSVGIPGYGVSGLFGDPNDGRAHGKDERVLIKSYYDSQEFLYRLVKEMSSGKVIP